MENSNLYPTGDQLAGILYAEIKERSTLFIDATQNCEYQIVNPSLLKLDATLDSIREQRAEINPTNISNQPLMSYNYFKDIFEASSRDDRGDNMNPNLHNPYNFGNDTDPYGY